MSICTLSIRLYSAEKQNRPAKYIPLEKCNNYIYVEVKEPIKNTLVTIRYFTREQGCAPGYYFKSETVTPLAHIRGNPYSCLVKRQSDGTSRIILTCQKLSTIISAQQYDTFVVHPESNKMIRITKNGSNVAEFTIK
jgi:hypothetical protein